MNIETKMIDYYIEHQTLVRVFTLNGYPETGRIHFHNDKVIVLRHDDDDSVFLMYKHAISTIESFDRAKAGTEEKLEYPLGSSSTYVTESIEDYWLNKFIVDQSRVTLITMKGYQEHCNILQHDDTAVIYSRYPGDNPNMVYKSAVSTILMKNQSVANV